MGHGGRVQDADRGDDCEDTPGVFRSEEVDQGDLAGAWGFAEGRSESAPFGCDRVQVGTRVAAGPEDRVMARSARRPVVGE
jgi:hypothetical protein